MEQQDVFVWASPQKPTSEQTNSLHGEIVYLSDSHPDIFGRMIDCASDGGSLCTLAEELLHLAQCKGATIVQPAGSPAFQMALGQMKEEGGYYDVGVMYAHSKWESEDVPQPDGSVKKVAIFRHLGWVNM